MGQFGALLWTLLMVGSSSAQAAISDEELQDKAVAAVAAIKRYGAGSRTAKRSARAARPLGRSAHLREDQHDLFFAQGFVVAQDRLFQMELWKRSARGSWPRSSAPRRWSATSTLGGSLSRRSKSGIRRVMPRTLDRSWKPSRPALTHISMPLRNRAHAGCQIEFRIAGFKPEHWKPEDCLNRLAAYSMTATQRAS